VDVCTDVSLDVLFIKRPFPPRLISFLFLNNRNFQKKEKEKQRGEGGSFRWLFRQLADNQHKSRRANPARANRDRRVIEKSSIVEFRAIEHSRSVRREGAFKRRESGAEDDGK